MSIKPPLGVMPEWRHKELRLQDIDEATKRYCEVKKGVPTDWIVESYLLREWLQNREEEKKEVVEPLPEKDFVWDDKKVELILDDLYSKIRNKELLTLISPGFVQSFKQSHSSTPISEGSKDWEVECFVGQGRNYWRQRNGGYHSEPFVGDLPESYFLTRLNIYKIHSVRRLSDGIVLSVGDETTIGTIKKFELKDGIMYWWNEHTWYYLNQAVRLPPASTQQAKPQPLFTTEDGKEVGAGATVWLLSTNNWCKSMTEVPENGRVFKGATGNEFKYFSSELALYQFVLSYLQKEKSKQ